MRSVLVSLLLTLRASVRDRAALQLEILALRHQLHVLERSRRRRLRLTQLDRLLWVWLSRVWRDGERPSSSSNPRRSSPGIVGASVSSGRGRAAATGSTDRLSGRPRVDSHDVGSKSLVGRATNPRRTLEAGHRRQSSHRGEVHDPASATAVADLADVPHQSHRANHGRRFLRRAHRHLSTAVRAGHPGPSAPARRARRRHRPSHRGMDGATTPRGVS